MTPQTACRVALAVGVLSVLAILAAAMALHDIYHGGGDLVLEWRMLRVSSLVILVFHASAWKGAGFPIDRDG